MIDTNPFLSDGDMTKLSSLKNLVQERIETLQDFVVKEFGNRVPNLIIEYSLKSVRLAGSATFSLVGGSKFKMKLHEAALLEYQQEYIDRTVVHEFAHLVQGQYFPHSKPHGVEWKAIMRFLGNDPSRCHEMNLSKALENFGIVKQKRRKQKRYVYECDCRIHTITSTRHNKIRKGLSTYSCRNCGQTITLK